MLAPLARDTFASGLAKVLLRRQVGHCARIYLRLVPLFLVFLIRLTFRSKIAMSTHTRVCARAHPQLHVNAICPGWCKTDMAGNCACSLLSGAQTCFNATVCAGWERPPKTAADGADTVRTLQLHLFIPGGCLDVTNRCRCVICSRRTRRSLGNSLGSGASWIGPTLLFEAGCCCCCCCCCCRGSSTAGFAMLQCNELGRQQAATAHALHVTRGNTRTAECWRVVGRCIYWVECWAGFGSLHLTVAPARDCC